MGTCRGVDVSAYQGAQDWAAHRARGVAFAFAKASEGQRSRDARFAMHIGGIKAAGIIPGAYHFAWPNQDAGTEAANYIGAVRPYASRGFTHWLDLERYSDSRNYSGRSAAQIRDWAGRWMGLVREAFPGQRVGIYTSADDLAKGHVPPGTPLWYPEYPWGPADWSRAEAAPRPAPSGWAPLIWQFTSQPMDRSVAYLSADGLRAWAGGTTSSEEDDMQLTDQVPLADWVIDAFPDDPAVADGEISVATALGSGWAHARRASVATRELLARIDAQDRTLAGQGEAIRSLAAALAEHHQEVDADALVARIEEKVTAAVERIRVRLEVIQEAGS